MARGRVLALFLFYVIFPFHGLAYWIRGWDVVCMFSASCCVE